MDSQEARLTDWLGRYRRIIYKVVAVYSHDRASGEDLYQEIALALWRSIPKFAGRSSESTWIYRVALNTAISAARKRTPEPAASVDPEQVSVKSESLDRTSELDWVFRRVRTMSLIDRSLVLLYLEGNSYREIAEILGISESNVGVKINRVKERLKQLLETEAD